MRAVLDTNVVVSALLKAHGNPARTLDAALTGQFQVLLSHDILTEYAAVLARPKFKFQLAERQAVIAGLQLVGQLVHPVSRLRIAYDDQDNIFLECAVAGLADYVVTGNLKHYPPSVGSIRVVNAREFLELLNPRP